jgi:hypothetical protein
MRDSQRSKLYSAERAAKLGGIVFKTEAEIQEYVDKLTHSVWFQARWSRRRIPVRVKRDGSTWSQGGWSGLHIAPCHMVEWVVLHEVAHVVAEAHHMHDAQYAAIFLALVTHEIGPEAGARLREQFKLKRVKHRVSGGAIVVSPARVKSKAKVVAEKKALLMSPLRLRERKEAAQTIRRAVAQGLYGPNGRKPRAHALATARMLEAEVQQAPSQVAARRSL